MSSKYGLLSAEETASILGIKLKRLYSICEAFDARNDDEWELVEGVHFEWLSKNHETRQFHEEGAMALAKYLQETAQGKPVTGILEKVIERLTNRRKHTRKMLVRRRVIHEISDINSAIVQGPLVFIDRKKTISILATNGKGLNAAARREQENCSLVGREPLEIGVHFDTVNHQQYWSQRGLVRIAQNMSENLASKSRKAWTEAVAEICEEAIEQQRKYLEDFKTRVDRVVKEVKEKARKTCQVSLLKQRPDALFELHAHHLFDKATRPELAAIHENLLAMHEDIHDGFHRWHGSGSCEPKDFVEYLTTVESWRFTSAKHQKHLHELINKLERLQALHSK